MSTEAPAVRQNSYDKAPATVLGAQYRSWSGPGVWSELREAAFERSPSPVVALDCYPGADVPEIVAALRQAAPEWEIIDTEEAMARPIEQIDAAIAPFLTEDRVFGVLAPIGMDVFIDPNAAAGLAESVRAKRLPTVLVGWGSATVPGVDLVVLADMARWELQTRQRSGAPNWRCQNFDEDILVKYKRSYFVEWRVADAHKRSLFPRIDYVLDTNRGIAEATLITAATFRAGLLQTVATPFRVVPFFDPGVWGGQWMKEVLGLPDGTPNFAWCFDCVPEENSLYLRVGDSRVELPALDLVLLHPRELLGELTFARFGAEFPIRFDFLDTMGGGNLSLQVHPLTDYIRRTFGMAYTQDESYYLLDAGPNAEVYLGLKTGIDPEAMLSDLARANAGEISFPTTDYVNTYPAKKHDHFLIPAGTVHCSGADSMVLEISATPYIFTFKMWDWDRLGLDGRPRPINLDHAAENIQWDRDSEWTAANLVDRVQVVAEGNDWVEERTGLHELEYIETRRHWFTGTVAHDTLGTLNVINLVEGAEITVESPVDAFAPFVVHYAETFIVPAAIGGYTIRPSGPAVGSTCATLKAWVRGTQVEPASQ